MWVLVSLGGYGNDLVLLGRWIIGHVLADLHQQLLEKKEPDKYGPPTIQSNWKNISVTKWELPQVAWYLIRFLRTDRGGTVFGYGNQKYDHNSQNDTGRKDVTGEQGMFIGNVLNGRQFFSLTSPGILNKSMMAELVLICVHERGLLTLTSANPYHRETGVSWFGVRFPFINGYLSMSLILTWPEIAIYRRLSDP